MLRSEIAELYSCSIYNVPTYGSPHQGMGPDKTLSLPLLPISVWPFLYILSYKKSVQLVFRSFSVIVALFLVVIWLCPWEKVISGSSYSATLTPPSYHNDLNWQGLITHIFQTLFWFTLSFKM